MRAIPRPGPDPNLVASARSGDPQALDGLIALSLPLVYNIAGRALRGHADVDDVVQETMLRVVRNLADLREPDAYRSWLASITIHQVRDAMAERRTAKVRSEPLDETNEAPDPAGDFADVTILRLGLTDQRRDVAEATRWLDEDDRELLSLWWMEESGELGRADLAGALGVTPPHAAVRVQRMKERLDTARAVVLALHRSPRCESLRELARTWDGVPNPLWRKRIARHVRECGRCGGRTRDLVPVARLLQGLPLVPVPAIYGSSLLPALHAAIRTGAGSAAATGAGASASAGASAGGGGGAGAGAGAGTATTSASAAAKTARNGNRILRLLHLGGSSSSMITPAVAVGTAAVLIAGIAVVVHKNPVTTTAAAAPQTSAAISASASAAASASASPSPSPSASPSPSPSTASAAPPAAAAPSSKKGVGVWSFDGASSALQQSTATWYYDWATTDDGISAPGAQFVPMIHSASDVNSTELAQAQNSGSPDLLTFNEPDMSSQANMTVSQALGLWPQLESTGLTLGAPAVATGAATPGGWLDQFMSGAQADGYRVDFIPLHWYGGDFDTADAVSQLESYIQSVYNRYGLPIWLTEFALIDFTSSGAQYPTQDQQAAFATAAIQMLDSLPYVQKYAWFGLESSSNSPTGLFTDGPSATSVGQAFEAAQ